MAKKKNKTPPKSNFLNRFLLTGAGKKSNTALNKTLKIAVIYLLFGCTWIILTDYFASAMNDGISIVLNASISKGLLYVVVTAALFFCLTYPAINKQVSLKDSLYKTNQKLGLANLELRRVIEKNSRVEIALLEAQRQAHIGSFEFDRDSNRLICTDEILKICGLNREAFSEAPETIIELIHPEDRSNVIQITKRALDEKSAVEYDCRINKTDGEGRIVRVHFESISDNRSDLIQTVGTAQDITEHKRTELALKESERSKSLLISHLPGIAYRCHYDREWTMTFISDGCYLLTGYRPEELINNNRLSYDDIICEEYRKAIWDEWERVLSLKEPFTYEYEIITASGDKKWVWEMGQGVFNEKGKLEALEGLIIDITKSKQRFNQIQYMSNHDSLTGLFNRSYYEKAKLAMDVEANLPLAIIKTDINGVRLINDAFGHSAGDKLINETAIIIQSCCRERDILARTGGDEFSIISPNTSQEEADKLRLSIIDACKEYNSTINDKALVISLSLGYSVKQTKETDINETEKNAEIYMDKRKLLEKKSHHNTILTSIMATMYARSNETEEHAQRLAELSKMIGEKMSLSQTSLDELQLLAMLHDIGKIGIDDRILNKPDSLTADEWASMKKHPEIGYMIAISSPEFAPIAEYILSHHERWDGSGYPRGLCGEEIPLLSRILAVADAYDAMTEDRVYRKALTAEAAIEEIQRNLGIQFDPQVAGIFVENIQQF